MPCALLTFMRSVYLIILEKHIVDLMRQDSPSTQMICSIGDAVNCLN